MSLLTQQPSAELERLRVLVDCAADAFFVVEMPDARIADVNASAC